MNTPNSCTVFEKIISPLLPLLKKEANAIKDDAITYRLSLFFFSINLLYGIIKGAKSIRLLITEIKTTPEQPNFDLIQASSSMYSEAFSRYDPRLFKRIFYQLIEKLNFMEVGELSTLGRFLCVDGSIFPAFQTMEWAHYKKTANALKIHMAFELNRMLPVSFIITDANASEKTALLMMLESGVTYIADRGYMSFSLFDQISSKSAFFIIRVKKRLVYTLHETLTFEIPLQWQAYLSQVTDYKITCDNDKKNKHYRLITFVVHDETYFIMTNRFDLKTHEIIMLYAYRWQVELLFRCIKRTFGALHLWSHEQKGAEIHFYIYLIAYILLLHFKQTCEAQKEALNFYKNKNKENDAPQRQQHGQSRTPPECGMVTILNNHLKNYWKLGIHWLKAVNNLAGNLFTREVVFLL